MEAPRLTRASTVEGAKKRQSQATSAKEPNVAKEKLSLGSKRFSLKQSPEARSEDGSTLNWWRSPADTLPLTNMAFLHLMHIEQEEDVRHPQKAQSTSAALAASYKRRSMAHTVAGEQGRYARAKTFIVIILKLECTYFEFGLNCRATGLKVKSGLKTNQAGIVDTEEFFASGSMRLLVVLPLQHHANVSCCSHR